MPEDEDLEEENEEEEEEEPASVPGDKRPRKPIKNYITPQGYRRLTEELDFLRFKKRPEVVNALADAAAEGDRSENAEYIYRKRQLRHIDSRLRFLGKRVDAAIIVDPTQQKNREKVFFGATVSVEDEDGEKHVYRIVGVDESEAASGVISWRSPIGAALLGKSLGEAVVVRWHAGEKEITIVEISY